MFVCESVCTCVKGFTLYDRGMARSFSSKSAVHAVRFYPCCCCSLLLFALLHTSLSWYCALLCWLTNFMCLVGNPIVCNARVPHRGVRVCRTRHSVHSAARALMVKWLFVCTHARLPVCVCCVCVYRLHHSVYVLYIWRLQFFFSYLTLCLSFCRVLCSFSLFICENR